MLRKEIKIISKLNSNLFHLLKDRLKLILIFPDIQSNFFLFPHLGIGLIQIPCIGSAPFLFTNVRGREVGGASREGQVIAESSKRLRNGQQWLPSIRLSVDQTIRHSPSGFHAFISYGTHPVPEAAKHSRTTTTMFHCWHYVLIVGSRVSFTPDVTGSCLLSTEHYPKRLGGPSKWFSPANVFLLVCSRFCLAPRATDIIFLPSHFLITIRGLQLLRCSSVFFWWVISALFEGILLGWLLGRFTTISSTLHLEITAHTVAQSPRVLELAL